ncbi:phosphotransferase [Stenotrophomonas sp.]|uniref:phosphotransferase enzyme family protein n=1 Tax=Stenotrophomonas sp. TaxID=69392 RepID=UPI002FC5E9E1
MNTAPHLVQGLNNDAVAADWPALGEAEIAWLATRYPALRPPCTLRWHSPRPLSAAAVVDTGNGAVFVKRHHGSVRSAAVLAEEHRFMAHLQAAGIPVVTVLRSIDGQTALAHDGWTYEVHTLGRGEDVYRDAPSWTPPAAVAHARQAGAMLARLHRAAAGYHAPQRDTHLLVARDDLLRAADPLASLAAMLPGRPALAAYLAGQDWQADLQRTVLPWHAGLAGRLQAEPRLWAHNDWHVSNLLWQPGAHGQAVASVLDFGLASPTSALYDLATAIERNAIAWLDSDGPVAHADLALALVDGYRQVLPLSPARMRLLADLLPIVHLDFALSEVEYFAGITGSTANADVAYHTFLLGHAAWFEGAQGQALRAALHGAA